MGSFSMTCAVSGLPIEAGDRVRYLLLTSNGSGDSFYRDHGLYIGSMWVPRVWPIRAVYNDYGSIEKYSEGAQTQAWLDAFTFDLVEIGWGDNTVHDVATSKDMSFERMLQAVWEDRIRVKPRVARYPELEPSEAIKSRLEKYLSTHVVPEKPGIPTIRGIQSLLSSKGFVIFDGTYESGSLIVNEEGWGRICVLTDDDDDPTNLHRAQKVLSDAGYATMVTAGSDWGAELLVRPLPGTEDYSSYQPEKESSRRVMQAMIRDDVWEELSGVSIESLWNPTPYDLASFKEAARTVWKDAIDPNSSFLHDESSRRLPVLAFTGGSGSILDLSTSFRLVASHASEMTHDEQQRFLDDAAEFMFISFVLSETRYQWRPSFANGPQYGEWLTHAQVCNALKSVADKRAEERQEDD